MKTFIVTGAATGIGRGIGVFLKDNGHRVIGIDQLPLADSLFSDIQVDLKQHEAPQRIIEALNTQNIEIVDGIVHNAAICPMTSLRQTSLSQWNETVSVNLQAPFFLTQALLPKLIAAKGANIVFIASVHAHATTRAASIYAMTKSGILSLTRSLAIELASDCIRVNAVIPGAIETAMLRRNFATDPTTRDKIISRTPLGRLGTPQNIASVVAFLLSRESNFITGSSIVVDGGALSVLSTEA